MNWIKNHKLLTAGIVVGVIVLYYLYKRMQANQAAAPANPAAGLPNFVYVGSGGGGAGGGPVAGSSQGTPGVTSGTSSPAANLADMAAASGGNVAAIPGASPAPVVSAPVSQDVSSAITNSPTGEAGTPSSKFPSSQFSNPDYMNIPAANETFFVPGASAGGGPEDATRGTPLRNSGGAIIGWSGWTAAQNQAVYGTTYGGKPYAGFTPSPSGGGSSGLLPYQQYIQTELAAHTNTQVTPAAPSSPATAQASGILSSSPTEGLGPVGPVGGGGSAPIASTPNNLNKSNLPTTPLNKWLM